MRRCLLVEHSPLIRKVARIVLTKLRYDVVEAETAESGLDHCRALIPDLIFLDWHLPGAKSSMDFLTGLRSMIGDAKPFIVYCTTENDPLEISKAMIAGCDDVLIKPVTIADREEKLTALPIAA